MYEKILVALDGSQLAERVLPYVKIVARGFNSHIELLQVIEALPTAGLTDPAHEAYRQRSLEMLKNEAAEYLLGVESHLKEDGFRTETVVLGGAPLSQPFHYILSEAEQSPATLIAMSTHGRHGVTRWALGSVADRVLNATTNPLLLIRGKDDEAEAAPTLESVIVPLDGSTVAEQILPHVIALSRSLGLKVLLVRVGMSPGEYYRYAGAHPIDDSAPGFFEAYEEISAMMEQQVKDYLAETAANLKRQGISHVEEWMPHGDPADEIISLARSTPNNLVAMTSHGRSGLRRWVLGSVADGVVRGSGDPVLLVKAVE